ncbi:MAG: efflux RND transporter periplasmic adaptor subunit [Cyclobacteriaceae bacterium]|nr:efflux RND transporter periplasmic adaptor subunit [Cyclobacteriaceae bacterium]
MNKLRYIIFVLILSMACSNEKEQDQTEVKATTSGSVNSVDLTPGQVSAIKLRLGHIEKRNLTNVIKANGYLDVPPQNNAVISPMITGYVRKINFLVGDNVKKGQTMAELESMDYIDMQQQYIELNARIAFLKEEYDRQKLLREQDAVSKKKYLMAEVEHKIAISTLDGLISKLNLLGVNFNKLNEGKIEPRILLKAPISGSVKKLNTVIGKHVDPSEEIFEIVNPEHLHLELNVYEKDVIKVKKGQKVLYKIPNLKEHIFEGKVFLVGKDLSEDKRSINVHVHIDEDEAQFTVGMYVNASIVIEDTPSYTLPVTAVVVDGTKEYIFKRSEISTERIVFSKFPVITGLESDGLIELTSMDDLTLEDDIVIDGAFYLLNAFTEGE